MQPPSRSGPTFETVEAFQPFEPLEPGDPVLIGGYRLLARLGTGPTGQVYLAATQSGRRLAIKAVRPDLVDDALRRRFKKEIGIAQRARGPFLAPVVDGHAEGSRPWVATEYVPGPSLARAVSLYGPLPVRTVRALMSTVAEALQALHDADMGHGALRPSNVLLTEEGPRLVDFGSLKQKTTAVDDVFMLGHVALFAATGHDAFPTPSRPGPPDLGGCPHELRGTIERCLAERPEERPEPRALVAELEEAPPGPDWLPPEIAELLPAYLAEPPRQQPPPLPVTPAPSSASAVRSVHQPQSGAPPATQPDMPRPARPDFAVPEPPRPAPTVPFPTGRGVEPVMGTYRHDLVVALGIGGGAFGVLVLLLLLLFLL